MKIPAFVSFLAAVTISIAVAAEQRTWTSRDGSATMEAAFSKLDGEKVVLILPNGRSQTVDRKFLSDADLRWIEENTSTTSGGEDSGPAGGTIPALLADKLINSRGEEFKLGAEGGVPKYYIFYYSASWCPPCRAFTPELVKFHRRMKGRNASFEVILVPNDNSEKEAIAYLADYRMPWPGVAWDARGHREIPRNPGGGIPALRLTDANGETLLTTEDVSRTEFLTKAGRIISGSGSTTAAN